ncbi:MAG: RagB/SusD family nutrient uptake outer membrane protein [Bacteroidetes bacterium]|nr:RagB/SusD family nutrient uptake outer membrane protein [Bacteroidota bacterium]
MKTIYAIIALLAVTAASCKKSFIDLAPKSSYSDANFYQNTQQFSAAVTAAYAPLRDVVVNDYLMSEMRSDNTIYQSFLSNRGTAYTDREKLSDFMDPSTDSYTALEWQYCYQVISRANIVITRLPAATAVSADTAARFDGQCKFLRALMYFKLVRLYGAVPLFVKEVTTAQDAFLPRDSVSKVYAQIISDASDAIKELPAPASFPQTGVATKGAATILLADVYVYLKRYADAVTLLNTLPAMGYSLNASYSDAFSPTTKNGRESLFEVQFLGGTTTGSTPNPLLFHFLPRSTTTALVTSVAINNTTTGGWNTPTQDLINSYEPGDKRLDISIGIVEGTYDASNYFAYSAVKSVIGYTTPPAGKVAVPYIKKWQHTPAANTGNSDNFPIYRYSEALLLLAEAMNEQGLSPLTPLNAVRSRAGLPAVTITDQAKLRDTIMHERRIELAFENKRWHDLVRSGKAVSVMNAFGANLKTQITYISPDSYIVNDNKLLYPIPAAEIGVNPQLTQNLGY